MKREIKELVESIEGSMVEGGVEFNKTACCALDRAFEKNPEVTRRLEDIVDDDETFGNFRKILKSADEIKFTPADNMKTACSQIAKRELERIEYEREVDKDLVCGHVVNEHIEALKYVVEKMGPTIN